jgi:hypothetical protein
MVEEVRFHFPDRLTAGEAYTRLAECFGKKWQSPDEKVQKSNKESIRRALNDAGFKSIRQNGVNYWQRVIRFPAIYPLA